VYYTGKTLENIHRAKWKKNTGVKPTPSRKQVGVKPVSNTSITLHTSDQHRFYTSFDPTNLRPNFPVALGLKIQFVAAFLQANFSLVQGSKLRKRERGKEDDVVESLLLRYRQNVSYSHLNSTLVALNN
jgi:hypothetical protein